MTYGLFVERGKRAVLLTKSGNVDYLESLKRTFEYRKQFGQLSIAIIE